MEDSSFLSREWSRPRPATSNGYWRSNDDDEPSRWPRDNNYRGFGGQSGRGSRGRGGNNRRGGNRGARSTGGTRETIPMGMRMLRRLQDASPDEVARLLHENKRPFQKLLESKIDDDKMELLVESISRACNGQDHQHERIKDILMLLHEMSFVDTKLTVWITRWSTMYSTRHDFEQRMTTTVELLSQILHLVPDGITSLGVALFVLKGVIKELEQMDIFFSPEVAAKLIELTEKHAKYLRDSREVTSRKGRRQPDNSNETPPDNYRDLPVLPTSKELRKEYQPFLRTNIVNGKYNDVDHYLDIHFRLLREDFIHPLREGIAEYTDEVAKRGARAKTRYQNFRLYNNVHAVGIDPSRGGLLYVLHFEVDNNLKRVRWEISKRLIFGSLICLSRDDFKTLIFGVVANRDPKQLQEGLISVTFDIEPSQSQELFSYYFKMAESSSYFEAYRHVLGCLQAIETKSFPFTRYVISANREPHMPRYIKNDPSCTYNLTEIANETVDGSLDKVTSLSSLPSHSGAKGRRAQLEEVRVHGNTGWPSAEVLGFDESQMNAYKAALKEEVCLIQGPPGTGKTYVGLKIVKTLLENKDQWGINKPLLVVCYTNHALDQFLEGILEFQRIGIVRIGGRSVSEKMKDLNINQVRRRCQKTGKWQYGMVMGEMTDCAKEIQNYKMILDAVNQKPLKFSIVERVMSDYQKESLEGFGTYCSTDVMAVWLCLSDEVGLATHSEQHRYGNGTNIESDGRNVGLGHENEEYQGEEQKQPTEEDESDYEIEEEYLDEEELERRYIDDDDDFLQSIRSIASHTPENVTVSFTKLGQGYVKDEDGFLTQGRKKPRNFDRFIAYKIAEQDIMTEEEATTVRDVWSLDERQRWRLYRYWLQLYVRKIHQKLRQLFADYDRKAAILKELRVDGDLEALRGQSVIGVTTTGAAKYNKLLRSVGSPIIVVEEAAEILEAHVITSLSEHTQHLILIGDHQQLRPNPTVYKLCKDYKLDVSLFERLMTNGMPCHRLSLQHRMRPEISQILKIHKDFYPGLLDHEMVKHYDDVLGVEKNVYFIEHDIQEIHDEENKSRSNLHEAHFLTSLCRYLLQQGYRPDQITILTAYRGQVYIFKQIMDKKTFEGVRVCPVDNFQGEENDIILFSFVRSNVEGNIGFLKVSNRVCVALSRAKKGLYCIGNFKLMSKESNLWATITSDLQRRSLIGPSLKLFCRNHQTRSTEVSAPGDFKLAPDGGCHLPCTARLDCGHTCQKKCHPSDREHRNILCKRRCEREICSDRHICPLLCYQQCDEKCIEIVEKSLPCSHTQFVKCFQEPDDIICKSRCERLLPCGHKCKNRCGEECASYCGVIVTKRFELCGHKAKVQCSLTTCPEKCKSVLKCEHQCQGTCGECKNGRYHVRCRQTCKRILVCGHICDQMCSKSCPPCNRKCENQCKHNKCHKTCGESCVECKEKCKWSCRHEVCNRSCGEDCDRKPCNEPCKKKLKCRHSCIGLCGESCPKLCRYCNREDVTTILFGDEDEPGARFIHLEDCGHIVEVRAMDYLMEQNEDDEEREIKLPECPWCKTPIRYNKRYNNRIKSLRRDLEQVKKKIKGDHTKIEKERQRLSERVKTSKALCDLERLEIENESDDDEETNYLHNLRTKMKKHRGLEKGTEDFFRSMTLRLESRYTLSLDDLASIGTLLDMYDKIQKLKESKANDFIKIPSSAVEDTDHFKAFTVYRRLLETKLKESFDLTEQEVEDWQREYLRCRHSLTLLYVVGVFLTSKVEPRELENEQKMIEEAHRILSDGFPFDHEREEKVRGLLEELKSINPLLLKLGITEKERDMIVKVMGFSRGHWFKCPKGHVYAIGDCGGANQRGKCPECDAPIGGVSHQLDEGNEVATEMDGALFGAFSEEANRLFGLNLGNL